MGKAFQRAHVQAFSGGLRARDASCALSQCLRATWHLDGGREKAPAAICRKVIEAKLCGRHEIEIWGSGNQTRSFMYIDDCLKGTQMILDSDIEEPLNLGSDELVTINQLVDIVEDIAGIKLNENTIPRLPRESTAGIVTIR